jgi:hypothetical protein
MLVCCNLLPAHSPRILQAGRRPGPRVEQSTPCRRECVRGAALTSAQGGAPSTTLFMEQRGASELRRLRRSGPCISGVPGAAARPPRSVRCTAWCPRARPGSHVELPPLRPADPTLPSLVLTRASWIAGGAAAAAAGGAPARGRQPAAHAGAGRRAGARAARRGRARRAGRRRIPGRRRAAVRRPYAAAANGRRGGRSGCAPALSGAADVQSSPCLPADRVGRLAAADAELWTISPESAHDPGEAACRAEGRLRTY